jgi:hypothetical protein
MDFDEAAEKLGGMMLLTELGIDPKDISPGKNSVAHGRNMRVTTQAILTEQTWNLTFGGSAYQTNRGLEKTTYVVYITMSNSKDYIITFDARVSATESGFYRIIARLVKEAKRIFEDHPMDRNDVWLNEQFNYISIITTDSTGETLSKCFSVSRYTIENESQESHSKIPSIRSRIMEQIRDGPERGL